MSNVDYSATLSAAPFDINVQENLFWGWGYVNAATAVVTVLSTRLILQKGK
ncbi:MAG: hypothetical protein MTP17_01125 [Candidatus Midichloria sp.]|nr:MAG: hypothetical protein MTP17_01125 [Candidatus Midichloria sp.]